MNRNLKYVELTEQIINCAYEVHRILGSGFLEKVYENAMLEEFKLRYLKAESQRGIAVKYKGIIIGDYFADLVIEDVIIVELKALDKLTDIHELQLKNYLKATGIEVGLLINFGKSVEVKRKYVQNLELQEQI
ncbi:MAG TPA: GxxExxY protein [Desulfuromonadales bacterium]|nr:GxxExxY protein [Desulfuromonadales bacterium]